MLENGETIPADQVSYPVDLDDYNRMFDEKTRQAVQTNLQGFGNALSSRGASLNVTIQNLPRFLGHLAPVAEILADDRNQLGRFFKEAGDVARVVAPVADRYAHSFEAGADTFEAWSRYPDRLRASIRNQAPTMRVGIQSFRVQRPFLADTARFSRALRGAAEVMPRTLPGITDALKVGTPVQRRLPEMNENLKTTLGALRDLAADDRTIYALRGVTRLVDIVNPLVRFAGPYVTVCNYWNYSWTNVSEHLTEPDPTGGSQRTLLNQAPRTRDPTAPSIGSIGAKQAVQRRARRLGLADEPARERLHGAAVDKQGQRRLRVRPARLPREAHALQQRPEPQDRHRPAHPRQLRARRSPAARGSPRARRSPAMPESGPAFPRELDKP